MHHLTVVPMAQNMDSPIISPHPPRFNIGRWAIFLTFPQRVPLRQSMKKRSKCKQTTPPMLKRGGRGGRRGGTQYFSPFLVLWSWEPGIVEQHLWTRSESFERIVRIRESSVYDNGEQKETWALLNNSMNLPRGSLRFPIKGSSARWCINCSAYRMLVWTTKKFGPFG